MRTRLAPSAPLARVPARARGVARSPRVRTPRRSAHRPRAGSPALRRENSALAADREVYVESVLTELRRLDLPEYVSQHLARSPLVLVAVQINFEQVDREVTHSRARQIQKLAGTRWRKLQPSSILTATMTPGGTVNEAPRQAYRLLSFDDSWSAQLNPDSVTVETRSYPGWGEMREAIAAMAAAVAEVYDPANEIRLGLRYVDQIALPEANDNWQGLIPDHLLGVALDPRLGEAVLASDQRVLLQLDDEVRCLFRHGLLANDQNEFGKVYLLDYDVFRENGGSYSAADVEAGIDFLHDSAGRLFRASVTDRLYDWLRG
jgi:uncharacterized protein (TIGR04255 family)